MANNKFERLNVADKLADAMIAEIKNKDYTETIVHLGDDTQEFFDTIIGLFSLKICSFLLEYAKDHLEEKEDIEPDEESLKDYEMLKKLFNNQGEG